MRKHVAIVGTVRTGSNYLRNLFHNLYSVLYDDYRGPMREFFHCEDFRLVYDNSEFPVMQEKGPFFFRGSTADFMHKRALILTDSPYRYVFSAHGHHLYGFPEIMALLKETSMVVFLDRRDKVAQFKSYVRASTTGQWVVEDGEEDYHDGAPLTPERMVHLHSDFCRRVWLTKAVQSAMGPHPLIWYEDLHAAPHAVLASLTGRPDAVARATIEPSPKPPLDEALLAPFLNADGTLRLDEPDKKWFWV